MAARDVQMTVRRVVGDEPSAEDRDVPDDAVCRAVDDGHVRAVRDIQMAVRRIVGDSGRPCSRTEENVRDRLIRRPVDHGHASGAPIRDVQIAVARIIRDALGTKTSRNGPNEAIRCAVNHSHAVRI